ncbi:hypothetical protein MtrunA17_Chr2g0286981 [Medicago truncatula]|uniref:Uncharacterized protein n=1 Tax=Medicago truncatula TaxID=3880 RepID=G7IFP8_MEDTR|nr:hypothetical protein MTR_2g021020 [Medicago truncatula]RHN72375.1 hypothetical protein MtrunA17_Chr2g0286981 [Medicago truncatula]
MPAVVLGIFPGKFARGFKPLTKFLAKGHYSCSEPIYAFEAIDSVSTRLGIVGVDTMSTWMTSCSLCSKLMSSSQSLLYDDDD